MYPLYPANECVRASWVRADSEIITKSMNLVSANTDRGNHVPKLGLRTRPRPPGGLTWPRPSGASAMTSMATPLAARYSSACGAHPELDVTNGSVPQSGKMYAGIAEDRRESRYSV
jgi:hypothetical protein